MTCEELEAVRDLVGRQLDNITRITRELRAIETQVARRVAEAREQNQAVHIPTGTHEPGALGQ